ncbi:hypothetical protein EGW08_020764 [Elysia chlorotica]|uniref:Aldose 1-epimerase n=1 Tax=Elysia chlorotica TaxID=188477 RepID=A0A433SQH5_ELYCH|nr:hypothetical protein EGW08_020764 [Elysia chlorotica]
MPVKITSDVFGKTKDGQTINRYTLVNSKAVSVQILDFGGVISTINIPDKNGKFSDVALGYDSVEGLENDSFYIGALIGRYANRIAGGQFTLDGKTYQLCVNNGPNSLHGGKTGFNKKLWKSRIEGDKVVVVYVSPDGEESYPGEVTLTVTYTLDDENSLSIDYHATTTKATPVNFTNHAYFNLGGHNQGGIKDHLVTFNADSFLPLDKNSIPTGEIKKVEGSLMDLRKPVCLGDRLGQVGGGTGYDNTYCLNNKGALVLGARVEHPPSGRFMECHTTEPSLHFYTGYYINDAKGKAGAVYGQFGGFCLEAQHYPDTVHQPSFPDCILRPGKVYTQKTVFKFGVV